MYRGYIGIMEKKMETTKGLKLLFEPQEPQGSVYLLQPAKTKATQMMVQ